MNVNKLSDIIDKLEKVSDQANNKKLAKQLESLKALEGKTFSFPTNKLSWFDSLLDSSSGLDFFISDGAYEILKANKVYDAGALAISAEDWGLTRGGIRVLEGTLDISSDYDVFRK